MSQPPEWSAPDTPDGDPDEPGAPPPESADGGTPAPGDRPAWQQGWGRPTPAQQGWQHPGGDEAPQSGQTRPSGPERFATGQGQPGYGGQQQPGQQGGNPPDAVYGAPPPGGYDPRRGYESQQIPYGPRAGYGAPQQPAYGTSPGWGAPAPGWGHAPPGWAAQRPKPGIIPLRPIGLGEIYDGAFQAIRTNPRTMIGFSAVVIAITALITTVPQAAALVSFGASDLLDPETAADLTPQEIAVSLGGLASSLLVPALIQALAVTVVTGLLIIAVSNAVLGRKTAPGDLWQRTKGRVLALIGLSLLLVVASIGIALVLFAPGVLVLVAGGGDALGVVLLLFGALLAVVVYIGLFYGLWALAAPALLLEDLSIIASLRRSARLVRRSFWRVLGIMLLTTLLVGVLSGVISVPFAILSSVIGFAQDPPNSYSSFPLTLVQLLVSQIGSVLSGAILYPLTAAVTALLYIDLRMRTEGLDIELMRATGEAGQ